MNTDEMAENAVDVGIKTVSWGWKIWIYIWRIIVNLITLAVLSIVLSSGETKFEILALSLLSLIYLSIVGAFSTSEYIRTEQFHTDYARFKYLRGLLKEQLSEDEMMTEAETYKTIEKKWRGNKIKFWINAVFSTVFYLIVILKILSVTILK